MEKWTDEKNGYDFPIELISFDTWVLGQADTFYCMSSNGALWQSVWPPSARWEDHEDPGRFMLMGNSTLETRPLQVSISSSR